MEGSMSFVLQFLTDYWLAILVVIVALTILIVLLYRWFVIKRVTLGPIELERKTTPPAPQSSPTTSVTISGNTVENKSEIETERDNTRIENNVVKDESAIRVKVQPKSKSKTGKGRNRK